MRKFLSLSLVLLTGYVGCSLANSSSDSTGHTYYSVRPLYQSAMPEKVTLTHGRALMMNDGWNGTFDFTIFGGRTTRSKKLAEFFMFGNKNALTVDSNPENLARDVNPIHFNIQYGPLGENNYGEPCFFRETFDFRPRQSVTGFGITWRQYFANNCCCEPVWWFEVGLPIYHVRNDMHLRESAPETSTVTPLCNLQPGRAANMAEAFAGTTTYQDGQKWEFGKIDGARKRTGVAEVELKLGYDYLDTDCCHLDTYLGVLIPTSQRPKGVYVFEPITGNNHHAGILMGGTFGAQIWENCDRSIWWITDMDTRYLFRNTQTRSFDLRNRDWSRYMLTIADRTAAEAVAAATTVDEVLANLTPGINIFTRKMHVTPRLQCTINTSFVYESCGFQAEVGYNFWARQHEKITLKDPWVEGPAIANLQYIEEGGLPNDRVVNRLSSIGNDNLRAGVPYIDSTTGTPETITVIREQDLDLASAAFPHAISNTIFFTAGYNWDTCCYPVYVGIGGEYEFNAVNTAVSRWTLWGKFGVSI